MKKPLFVRAWLKYLNQSYEGHYAWLYLNMAVYVAIGWFAESMIQVVLPIALTMAVHFNVWYYHNREDV